MRFTLIKDLSKHTQMRALLLGMLFFLTLFLLVDIAIKDTLIGLNLESISSTLYGNEEEYIEGINEGTLLEMIHADIFFMMMSLTLLSSIYTRVMGGSKTTNRLISVLFISALATLGFLLLAFYTSALFINAYIFTFALWHTIALLFSIVSFKKLL